MHSPSAHALRHLDRYCIVLVRTLKHVSPAKCVITITYRHGKLVARAPAQDHFEGNQLPKVYNAGLAEVGCPRNGLRVAPSTVSRVTNIPRSIMLVIAQVL